MFSNFKWNWKTSLGGIATVALGVQNIIANNGAVDNGSLGAIISGLALLFAKDGDKSHTQPSAK